MTLSITISSVRPSVVCPECHDLDIVMLNIIMLRVSILSVMAPARTPLFKYKMSSIGVHSSFIFQSVNILQKDI
jgi:hypothetical protein